MHREHKTFRFRHWHIRRQFLTVGSGVSAVEDGKVLEILLNQEVTMHGFKVQDKFREVGVPAPYPNMTVKVYILA